MRRKKVTEEFMENKGRCYKTCMYTGMSHKTAENKTGRMI